MLRALWFALIPALLAVLAQRGLVPAVVVGAGDAARDIVRVLQEHPVPLAVGLFFVFSAAARYWRSHLPGGQYLVVATRSGEPALARRRKWEILSVIGVALLCTGAVFAVRARVIESYSVLSGSMLPTLEPEDRVLGNRLAYRTWSGAPSGRAPARGDMIVFKSSAVDEGNLTDAPDFLVKRVIGLPGDRISMRHGIPVINGWTVPVCDVGEYLYIVHGGQNGLDGRLLLEFLEDRVYLTVHAAGSATFDGTYHVQPNELFVLGDNRNNSSDSRAWNQHHGGGVPFDAIEARVQRFIAGRHADMTWDFRRVLRPIDSLATAPHLDGVNLRPLEDGIERCLQTRPQNTYPPPPNDDVVGSGAAASSQP
jgi:signal peptidase I